MEEKINQVIVLLEIFRILRTKENRNGRKKLYEIFIDYTKTKNSNLFISNKKIIDQIQGDFDEIGFLFQKYILDENLFFEIYSDTVRRIWISLRQQIKEERNKRLENDPSGSKFLLYFEKLAIDAKDYRDKMNLSEPGFTDFRN
jgi:hypothetical protein|tara:strand:- start:34 stop:465 length:432 start_codon:yes stop_codon:yes gene_type:complete